MPGSASATPPDRPARTPSRGLAWKWFDGGRLILAQSGNGYFELIPGDRFRYVRLTASGMHTTDLGPCLQATLEACMALCEHYPHAP